MQGIFDTHNFITDEECSAIQGTPVKIPDVVEGRVAHIDGDYLAYIVSADRVNEEDTTLAVAIKHLHEFVQQIMTYSGSTDYLIHLTSGNKGNRAQQALLKPYQANRENKEKPLLLGDIRSYMSTNMNTFVCNTAEADDSLAMCLHHARIGGAEDKAVLVSQDKDLRMVKGWHLDWMSQEMFYVDDFGGLVMEEKKRKDGKSTKKLRGTGGMWFFAQLMIGDTADNISGLPKLTGNILNECKPTKAIAKAQATLADPKAKIKAKETAQKTLDNRKASSCGEVTSYEYLKDCKTLCEAFARVMFAYEQYGKQFGFKDYDGNDITTQEAFESECKLLYMRHNLQEYDFKEYLKHIVDNKL